MSGGGSAIASGGMGLFGSQQQAEAAKQAAAAQAQAANNATLLQGSMYEQNRADQGPYRQAGYGALAQLQYALGMSPTAYGAYTSSGGGSGIGSDMANMNNTNDFIAKGGDPELANMLAQQRAQWAADDRAKAAATTVTKPIDYTGFQPTGKYGELNQTFDASKMQTDPGYQFRMDQAMKALSRSAAAKGSLLSGSTLKGIQDYSQGLASQEYQNAYNRFSNDQTSRFNRLAALAGIGQTATNMTGQLGANAANQMGEYGTQAANAAAAGRLGQANAWNTGINNAMNAMNNYSAWNSLNSNRNNSYGNGYESDRDDPSSL